MCPHSRRCFPKASLCDSQMKECSSEEKKDYFPNCLIGDIPSMIICQPRPANRSSSKIQAIPLYKMCDGQVDCRNYADETSMLCPGHADAKPCLNGGTRTFQKNCLCPPGYAGELCEKNVCLVECRNGGTCIGEDKCQCPEGFEGNFCEAPICEKECGTYGVCVSPDLCGCTNGFFGARCEYSQSYNV